MTSSERRNSNPVKQVLRRFSLSKPKPEGPQLGTIAPLDHRENTTLHVLKDTFLHSSSDDAEKVFSSLTGNVLILGGYSGSTLYRVSDGKRIWAPLKMALDLRTVDIELGLKDEDEERAEETIVPKHMVTAVAGVLDLGKRLKDKLKALDKANPDFHFHNWGYDWRLSLDISSAKLVQKLESIKAQTGRGTVVLSHSMGGLVALHALARAPDPSIFERLVCAGTPFAGTPNILGPIRHGETVLRNTSIRSPQSVLSERSSFYMLRPGLPIFETPTGAPIDVDLFSVREWSQLCLSPLTDGIIRDPQTPIDETARLAARATATEAERDEHLPRVPLAPSLARQGTQHSVVASPEPPKPKSALRNPFASKRNSADHPMAPTLSPDEAKDAQRASRQTPPDEEIVDYLERTFQRVLRFRSEWTELHDPSKSYPPIVLVTSSDTPTVRGCVVDSRDRIRDGDFGRLLYAEGDGIITRESATALPEPWTAHAVVESSHGHVSLFGDIDAMAKALTV